MLVQADQVAALGPLVPGQTARNRDAGALEVLRERGRLRAAQLLAGVEQDRATLA